MTLKNKIQAVSKVVLPYVLICLPFVMMDGFIRILATEVNYFRGLMVAPSILFSVIWIALIICVTINLPKMFGK